MSAQGSRLERLDARAARRWALATRAAFAAHRAEIDELNVFPVPDRDTGTNLYITLDSALEAVREPPAPGASGGAPPGSGVGSEPSLVGDVAALARATLLAARGNSGVILSQVIQGLSEVIAEAEVNGAQGHGDNRTGGMGGIDGQTLARAMRRASDKAHASVTRPVEGTILSVAAAAAGAAERAAGEGSDLYAVAHASLSAARVALAATTAQLPILARAGVVDAGGLGYVLVLEALERVIAGDVGTEPQSDFLASPRQGSSSSSQPESLLAHHDLDARDARHARNSHADNDSRADNDPHDHPHPHGRTDQPGAPAYEVMYLLSDSTEEQVARLRERLDALGDSVLVVGGEDLWNVHAHVDDVGAAIQAGIEAGRPHRIAVAHFGDQRRARTMHPVGGPVAVVACVNGYGLVEVFRAAGAMVVSNGPDRRASAGRLLDAIRSAASRCVLVLPNDPDAEPAALAAASAAGDAGFDVHVVRSRSAVQGIAALAVFEPTASGRDNLVAMSGAADAARHGAVAVASKRSLTSAGWCLPGDVLGLLDGDVVVVGQDLAVVGADVVTRLLARGGELLTVINGAGAGPELSAAVAAAARAGGGDVEVAIIEGGQATYPLLLGVE